LEEFKNDLLRLIRLVEKIYILLLIFLKRVQEKYDLIAGDSEIIIDILLNY